MVTATVKTGSRAGGAGKDDEISVGNTDLIYQGNGGLPLYSKQSLDIE